MSEMPFVSVVVPAYNNQDTVGFCIESLLAQDYPKERCEIIVVDNNSTDDTADVISRYSVKLLHERGKQSAYAARNLGIRHAKGEIIAFTDADCVADSSWLTNLLGSYGDPAFGCFSGLIKAYEPRSLVARLLARYQAERFCRQSQSANPMAVGGNAAYVREVLEGIGLFDDTLRSGGDLELAWRMQQQTGKRIAFVEQAVVYHRYPDSIVRVFRTSHFRGYGQAMINEKYHRRLPLWQFVRSNLRVILLHSYYSARLIAVNPWRRRSAERVFYFGFRAIGRSGAVLGHLHHALDKALGRVHTADRI